MQKKVTITKKLGLFGTAKNSAQSANNLGLSEVEFKSLGDRASDHIRDMIIQGKIPAGSRLPEETLASSLCVSRACVREAFMRLEAEGLIRRVRNRYTEVVTLADHDAEEIQTLRIAIECLAVETCIANRTLPLDEIKKRVDIMVSLNKVAEPDTKAIMEADFDFHESIVNASGNQRAIQFWNCLKSQMKMLLYAALENINTPLKFQSAESHRAIVDALEEGNCQEAIALIKTHIVLTSLTSASSHNTISASEENSN